jgi:hypothetical protein
MTELVGTEEGQVVKWNDSTNTWYAGTGGGGGGAVESVGVTAPITNTGTATAPIIGIDQTAIGIASTQVTGLGSLATKSAINLASGSSDYTGTLPAGSQASQSMGGDVSGTTANATVAKIQGNAFSSATPVVGQTPVWDGTSWVPSTPATSGSGGGGVTYYLNKGTTQTGTGLPSPTYELGREAEVAQSNILLTDIVTTGWTKVGGFVTDALDPSYDQVPPGLWTFNVWCNSTAGSGNQSYFRITLYKYNGTDNPEAGTELGHSDNVYMYDRNTTTQYTADVLVGAGKTLTTSDRIYVLLEVRASTSGRDARFYFGDATPTHTHSTIPSVTGTGLVKVIDGVVQSPASTLVDADVASNAAIARTKLAASDSGDKGKLLMNDASSGAIVAAAYASVAQGGLGTGSNTGASGKILVGSGSSSFAEQTMSGDATIAANGTLTLATLSPAVPTTEKGSATKVAKVTLNAKGLVTSLVEESILLTSAGLPAEVVYTNTAQIISGNKTFSGEVTLSALTASRVLKLDSNGKAAADYIRNADVATDAAIARDKLAVGVAANSLIVNNASDKKLSELAISATVGHVLKSNGTAAEWGAISLSSSNSVTGALGLSNGGTNNSSLTASVGQILYTDATKVVALGAGTDGQYLKSKGAAAPEWSSVAYDIAGEFVGAPSANAVVMRFVANRAFTFGGANAYFSCTSNTGASTATFTVKVNGTSKGTVTIAGYATSGNGAITSTLIAAGDNITVEATTPANVIDVWFTLPGVL